MEEPEKREGMSVAWVGSKAEVCGWILLRRKVQRRKVGVGTDTLGKLRDLPPEDICFLCELRGQGRLLE